MVFAGDLDPRNNIRENFLFPGTNTWSKMSILKYMQVHRASELPNPEGSLSKTLSAASICCVNEEVRMVKEAAAKLHSIVVHSVVWLPITV